MLPTAFAILNHGEIIYDLLGGEFIALVIGLGVLLLAPASHGRLEDIPRAIVVAAIEVTSPQLEHDLVAFGIMSKAFGSPMPGLAITSGALLFYAAYAGLLIGASWLLFRRKALNT